MVVYLNTKNTNKKLCKIKRSFAHVLVLRTRQTFVSEGKKTSTRIINNDDNKNVSRQ